MKIYKLFFIGIILTTLFLYSSCKNKSSSNYNDLEEYYSEDDGFEDGTYCADVGYYNPNTGTNNTYTLEVEVENNKLVIIYWNNGGWLDEDHFSAEELDEDGYCSFTSDKGYDYTIQIIGKDCGYTDQTSFKRDFEQDEESVTCLRCGEKKDEYDDYCSSCKRKIDDEDDNTCSRCGSYEYGVYSGLCSNCKDDDDEKEED